MPAIRLRVVVVVLGAALGLLFPAGEIVKVAEPVMVIDVKTVVGEPDRLDRIGVPRRNRLRVPGLKRPAPR